MAREKQEVPPMTSAAIWIGGNPDGLNEGDRVSNEDGEETTVSEIRGNILYLDKPLKLNARRELILTRVTE